MNANKPELFFSYSRLFAFIRGSKIGSLLLLITLNFLNLVSSSAWASEFSIRDVKDALYWETENGDFSVELGGTFDLEFYAYSSDPLGLVHMENGEEDHLRPRLTLTTDAFLGERVYVFSKFRWDDGFDPNYGLQKIRFDEYFARIQVLPGNLDVQVGKFGTIFGNWAGRHDSWENPFINAPLPYDEVTSVFDEQVWPSATAFANFSNAPNNIKTWLPVLWGPAYTQGIAFLGTLEPFDLNVSFKNRAISSRPNTWEDYNWDNPTWTSRLGYRPNAAWNFGLSGSWGPYLKDVTANLVPANSSISDFNQITLGADLSYSFKKLQVWAEAIASRFEVPNAGDADSFSYYVEGKYKLTPKWFSALRWGQQFFKDIQTSTGYRRWDNSVYRAEAAVGYRYNRNVQTKFQYTFQEQDAAFQNATHTVIMQLTLKL